MDYIIIDSFFETEGSLSQAHGQFVPLGLLILHNVLKSHGYTGKTLLTQSDYETCLAGAREDRGPIKLVGITASTWTRFDAIRKIKECRGLFPQALIVAGGFHFGNCAADAIRHIPELDLVVRGEGDEVILDLMKLARGEGEISGIQGITYRGENGEPVEQGPRLIVDVLPSLEFLDSTFTPENFAGNILHPDMPIPAMNVVAGRGCPFQCIFCSVRRVRYRPYPASKLVDLIERITSSFKIEGVKFWDDSLTINEAQVIDLCNEIIRRQLKIFWFCDSRADINLDLIPLMYAAGCRFISVGLETGSPKIQKIVGKKVSNEQIFRFAAKCREVGIRPFIFLMAGFPDETWEDLEMTVKVAQELSSRYQAISGCAGIATILPGTRLEEIARERGVLAPDFSWCQPYHNPLNAEYGQACDVPIYIEGITPQMFKEANRAMLSNYALSLPLKVFIKNALENLWSRDLSWTDKLNLGKKILASLAKKAFSSSH